LNVETFWASFATDDAGHLIWTRSTNNRDRRGGGYGNVWFNGRQWQTHRLAYALVNGPTPRGKVIRHMCGNSLCSRPDHLALGSQWENLHDYFAKEGQWTAAKLTPQQVSEIRHSTESSKSLAARFCVSPSEISMIRKGHRYEWVDFLRKEVIGG
jgi:hypothetical protein